MPNLISAKELATLCGTDGKTFRRFVRAQAANPDAIVNACGQGNRYGFTPDEARSLRDAFASWSDRKRSNAPERSVLELEALLDVNADDEIDANDENI